MDVFDLAAKITLDSSDYNKGLDSASNESQSFGDKLKGGLANAGKITAGVIAGVGTAVTVAGAAFTKGISSVASYGDEVDKASQKVGISAKAYQEWDFIAQHSGTSMDSLKTSFKTLANQAQSGSDSFTKLGISLEDAASMSTEDLFSAVITGLQGMEEGTERTAIASDLLGKGAIEMGALLNTSAEDTEAMKEQVNELGGVMSDDAVKASAAFTDSLQNLKTAISGMSRGVLSEFLPSVTTVMDGLTEIFSGDSESGLSKINEGITGFIDTLSASLPSIMDSGASIITTLMTAIVENLPILIESATQAILTIATGLINNLPDIISAGLEIILSLANSIAESLPELIPTIVDVILQIVETLTEPDSITNLLDAALKIILAIGEGLIKAIPELVSRIPQIISNIVTAFTSYDWLGMGSQLIEMVGQGISAMANGLAEFVSNCFNGAIDWLKSLPGQALQWGMDMIQGFIDGIGNMIGGIGDAIGNVVGTITSFLHFSRPDKGPLRDYETWMPDFMGGLAEGIDDNAYKVEDALNGLTSDMGVDVNANADVTKGGTSGAIVINVYSNGDAKEIAEEVERRLQQNLDRREAVYA